MDELNEREFFNRMSELGYDLWVNEFIIQTKLYDRDYDQDEPVYILYKNNPDIEKAKEYYIELLKWVEDLQFSELIAINGEEKADEMFREHYLDGFSLEDFLKLTRSFYRVIFENDDLFIFQKTIIEKERYDRHADIN